MPSTAFFGLREGNVIAVTELPSSKCLRSLLLWSMNAKQRTGSGSRATPHSGKASEDKYLNRTRLIAAACHDMRQPLQALGMFSASLKGSNLDPAQHKLALQIDQSVGILHDMLNQMLTMQQLDAPMYLPNICDVSIAGVLSQLENDFEPLISHKGLQFKVERCAAFVRSDILLLYRAISNLVSNAICYTERGGVTVRCIENTGKLRIEVSDTGIGIAAEDIPNVFDDFFRIDRVQSGGHLGLGLANVRRIALLLGLRVDVRSELGAGSTFMLEMDSLAG